MKITISQIYDIVEADIDTIEIKIIKDNQDAYNRGHLAGQLNALQKISNLLSSYYRNHDVNEHDFKIYNFVL